MSEPMDVDEALAHAGALLDETAALYEEGDEYGDKLERALNAIVALRARLRREREAIEKVRDQIAYERSLLIGVGADEYDAVLTTMFTEWLAALDAILRGEGTT